MRYPPAVRRQARTVALAPAESTRTTCSAVMPAGTRHRLAGSGSGLGAGAGAGAVAAAILVAVAVGRGGVDRVVAVACGVEGVAVVDVMLLDVVAGRVCSGDLVAAARPGSPAPHAVSGAAVRTAAATSPAAYLRVLMRRRSAGSRGSPT